MLMTNDVFISYSTKDKHVADAVCSTLENNGVRCWIAPRDVFPGSDWAQSITNAIKASKLMVLIFSQNSNSSPQVTKELNLAVGHNLMVVPFKIDNSVPSGSMEYFLADMHWLDAIDGDMHDQINRLKDVIVSVLQITIKDEPDSPSADNNAPHIHVDGQNNINTNTINYDNIRTENTAATANSGGRKIGLLQAYQMFWKKCFVYKGCATRSEFWKAVAVDVIIAFVVLMICVDILFLPEIALIYLVVSTVPFVSLGIRRLHDSNHSGHWMWLMILGYVSIIPIVLFCFPSVENNRYKINVTSK